MDLNRSGVPLVEIVSEPDMRSSSSEAAEYLKALRDVLVYLGVNDGNLEEGSFRCDANVSVMREGRHAVRTAGGAEEHQLLPLRAEGDRLRDRPAGRSSIESGGKVARRPGCSTRSRGETRSMRSKEEAHDYRYFPEPDLPPLRIPAGYVERIERELPELPRAKLQRFSSSYALPAYDAKILVGDRALADLFEKVQAVYRGPARSCPTGSSVSCSG